MTPLLAGKDASAGAARAGEYARHRPEQTLLYQLIEAHYPAFVAHLAARERTLPVHVQREFEATLKCGRLEHGFLRVRCADCHAERLVAFSCKRRGFYSGHPALRPSGQPAAVQNRSRRFCARAAVRAGWRKGRPCWSMKCYPENPCGSGCSASVCRSKRRRR